MLVRTVYDDDLAHAAYLIGCQRTGEAIVIDPARDVDLYLDLARAHDLRLVAAAETHIHADFLSGARELHARHGAHAYLSNEGGPDWQYAWAEGLANLTRLANGDEFRVGEIRFRAVHTPGHTPEHMSYEVYDRGCDEPIAVLSGDFVFVGDLGRPDLLETAAGIAGAKDAAARDLYRSTKKLQSLPEFTQVWPAHGSGSACGKALGAVPQSTIGYEKRHNPSLAAASDEEGFVASILSGQPSPPLYFARMKTDNRDGPPLLGALPRPAARPAGELLDLPRDTIVLDSRPWAEFRDGHVPGSIWAPLDVMYAMVAGSYVEPAQTIALVCDPAQVERATRVLVRIGLDRVESCTDPVEIPSLGARLATTPEIDATQLPARLGEVFMLDCRNPDEFDAGTMPNTVNIPYTRLAAHLDELPRDTDIVVHCQTAVRSAAATSYLRRAGLRGVNFAGGYVAWLDAQDAETAQA